MPIRRLILIVCWAGVAFAVDPSLFDGEDEPVVEAGPASEEKAEPPEDWGVLSELEVPGAPEASGKESEGEEASEENGEQAAQGQEPDQGEEDTGLASTESEEEGAGEEQSANDVAESGNTEAEDGAGEEEEQGGEASAPGFEPDEAAREVFVPSERILPGHAVDFPWDI